MSKRDFGKEIDELRELLGVPLPDRTGKVFPRLHKAEEQMEELRKMVNCFDRQLRAEQNESINVATRIGGRLQDLQELENRVDELESRSRFHW